MLNTQVCTVSRKVLPRLVSRNKLSGVMDRSNDGYEQVTLCALGQQTKQLSVQVHISSCFASQMALCM